MLVSAQGTMRWAPLLAVVDVDLAARGRHGDRSTHWRCHAGIEIACVMLAGHLLFEPIDAPAHVLGPEDVAVVATGTRLDYRWRTVDDEPVRALMLWMHAPAHTEPGMTHHRREPRAERVGALATIASTPSVTIRAGVLAVDQHVVHSTAASWSYVVSTLGAISLDGTVAEPGDAIIVPAGVRAVRALGSTEVVVVEPAS